MTGGGLGQTADMDVALGSIAFLVLGAWCAERLVRAERPRWAAPPALGMLATWMWLWSLREPTPLSATWMFLLIDLAVLAVGVLGVFRLLGGFEDLGGDDWPPGEDDGDPAPLPGGPHPSRRIRRPRDLGPRGPRLRPAPRTNPGRAAREHERPR